MPGQRAQLLQAVAQRLDGPACQLHDRLGHGLDRCREAPQEGQHAGMRDLRHSRRGTLRCPGDVVEAIGDCFCLFGRPVQLVQPLDVLFQLVLQRLELPPILIGDAAAFQHFDLLVDLRHPRLDLPQFAAQCLPGLLLLGYGLQIGVARLRHALADLLHGLLQPGQHGLELSGVLDKSAVV